MKPSVRQLLNYWIPPNLTKPDQCPICEGPYAWTGELLHAPECPTQADPVAVAMAFRVLFYISEIVRFEEALARYRLWDKYCNPFPERC